MTARMTVICVLQLKAVSDANTSTRRSSTALMTAVCRRLQPQPRYSESDGRRTARLIDRLSHRLFPFSFVAFNVIYWTIYVTIENPV